MMRSLRHRERLPSVRPRGHMSQSITARSVSPTGLRDATKQTIAVHSRWLTLPADLVLQSDQDDPPLPNRVSTILRGHGRAAMRRRANASYRRGKMTAYAIRQLALRRNRRRHMLLPNSYVCSNRTSLNLYTALTARSRQEDEPADCWRRCPPFAPRVADHTHGR
jgi:hypothetical protein